MTAERSDFGARLRAAREARGLSLSDLAAATKISALVLDALERNDASRLPGGLFSRAFVRAYAKEVGLDPEQTVREFGERFSNGDSEAADEAGRPRGGGRHLETGHSGLRWLGLVITLLLVGVWMGVDRYYANRSEQGQPASSRGTSARQQPAPAPPKTPDSQAQPATDASTPLAAPATSPSPAAQTAAPATGGSAGGSPVADGRGQPGAAPPKPAPSAPAASAAVTPGAPSQTAATTPAAPGSGLAADPNLPLQIVLTPTAPCWVSAKVDGNRIVGRTVQPGEKVPLSAATSIVLTAGDAAALSYTINNAPGRPLGTSGQVVTVVITANNYRTFMTGRQ